MKTICAIVTAFLCAQVVAAQNRPVFEVASVKPSRIADSSWSVGCAHPQGNPNIPSGRCQAKNAPLRRIILQAYDLPIPFQEQYLLQAPGRITTERYDIDAKAENSSTPSQQLLLMLQNLLADRFKLKLHTENRDIGGYGLVVAKGGPKLKPVVQTDKVYSATAFAVIAWDTGQLTVSLSNILQAPVSNKTNISGPYEFTLPRADITGDQAPSIFTLIEERWGLKLQSEKVPAKVLVIDHIERPTTN